MFDPDRKICIYIENGLFPQVFWDVIYKTVYIVGGKSSDVTYFVKKYTAHL